MHSLTYAATWQSLFGASKLGSWLTDSRYSAGHGLNTTDNYSCTQMRRLRVVSMQRCSAEFTPFFLWIFNSKKRTCACPLDLELWGGCPSEILPQLPLPIDLIHLPLGGLDLGLARTLLFLYYSRGAPSSVGDVPGGINSIILQSTTCVSFAQRMHGIVPHASMHTGIDALYMRRNPGCRLPHVRDHVSPSGRRLLSILHSLASQSRMVAVMDGPWTAPPVSKQERGPPTDFSRWRQLARSTVRGLLQLHNRHPEPDSKSYPRTEHDNGVAPAF